MKNFTPKAHVLFAHVKQFLDFKNHRSTGPKKGLGCWSEHKTESVHHDFESFSENKSFKRQLGHPDYNEIKFRCISSYAASHI